MTKFDLDEQATLEYLKTGKYQRGVPYFLKVGLFAGKWDEECGPPFYSNIMIHAGGCVRLDHKHHDRDVFVFSGNGDAEHLFVEIPGEYLDDWLTTEAPQHE
jgi:hypothetical protein